MNTTNSCHPWVHELRRQLQQGKLTRREFVRYASLMGVSAVGAVQMTGVALPGRVMAGQPKTGGTLKVAAAVQKITHPAQISWIMPSNQMLQAAEYLTLTDKDNITHPYLLENWQVSDDLKTWTLNLRRGVTFSNGDRFTADDVVFTIGQWLDKDVGSAMLGLMGGYLDPTGIEKAGDHQVVLHLKHPEIAVPEHLFHFSAFVLNHRTFDGDWIKQPHGTGPFALELYREGERCVMKRRTDYWQTGHPYLDAVEFIDMGTEIAPQAAALQAGDIDLIDLSGSSMVSAYQALKGSPGVNIISSPGGWTRVIRMRVDMKPWDDERVRMAMKLCQHREKTLALAHFGEGLQGQDTHVCPKHPEYCDKPIPAYAPEKARALLAQAGYPKGLDATMVVPNGYADVVRWAEIFKQDAAPAGLRITLQPVTNSQYWETWSENALGITTWAHRPLGTQLLNLAYTSDDDGKPVPWNETRWVDPEFDRLLKQANGTLDVDERRALFCQLEDIQMKRGSIGLAYWCNFFNVASENVQNFDGHPAGYLMFKDVWVA